MSEKTLVVSAEADATASTNANQRNYAHVTAGSLESIGGVNKTFIDESNLAAGELFRVNTDGLFTLYLNAIPVQHRQVATCSCCSAFFRRYAGLVRILEDGSLRSMLWNENNHTGYHRDAIAAVRKEVESRRVNTVFFTDADILGSVTKGDYNHFFATRNNDPLLQRMTGKLAIAPYKGRFGGKDFTTTNKALGYAETEFASLFRFVRETPGDVTTAAVYALTEGGLNRAEQYQAWAEALSGLVAMYKENAGDQNRRVHLLRRFAHQNPAWCHIGSSMMGVLYSAIKAGKQLAEIKKTWDSKTESDVFMRPTTQASHSTLAEAAAYFAQKNLYPSFERRIATFAEVKDKLAWVNETQKVVETDNPTDPRSLVEGMLDKAKEKPSANPVDIGSATKRVSVRYFTEEVLPNAADIHVILHQHMDPRHVTYAVYPMGGLIAPKNADSAPILWWDHEEDRNPFSYYTHKEGIMIKYYKLQPEVPIKVLGVAVDIHKWSGKSDARVAHQHRPFMILEGAEADLSAPIAACLFPEFMKSELRDYRRVIESISNQMPLHGVPTEGDIPAYGVFLSERCKWVVLNKKNHQVTYIIDYDVVD